MSEVLSQDEINALLEGVGGDAAAAQTADSGAAASAAAAVAGSISAPTPTAAGRVPTVEPLDLMKQERSVKGGLPALDMVLDQFSRQLRAHFAVLFGKPPTITVSAMEQLRFGPVQQKWQAPLGLHLFRLLPLRGQGILVLPPELVSAVVQVSFGGDPRQALPAAKREFSPIETLMVQKLGDKLLGYFRDAFKQIEPLDCTRIKTETNPLFAGIVGPQDIVLVIELRLDGDGLADVPITFCLPNASLDPIRARLFEIGRSVDEEEEGGAGDWGARINVALADVEVEITAELGRREMPMQSVLDLQVGDLISLGTGREGPVVLRVAGRPRFVGTPGVSSGSNAVQVTGTV